LVLGHAVGRLSSYIEPRIGLTTGHDDSPTVSQRKPISRKRTHHRNRQPAREKLKERCRWGDARELSRVIFSLDLPPRAVCRPGTTPPAASVSGSLPRSQKWTPRE
jgi:hypothetical protein